MYTYVVRGREKLWNEQNILKPEFASGFGHKQAQEIGQTRGHSEDGRIILK